MAIVTIAKGLNLKNKLVGEKVRLFGLFRATNSHRDDQKVNYDPQQLLAEYEATVEKLIAVKTAIAKANVVIYDKIYRIAELKSKIHELRQVPTNDKDEEQERYVRGKDEPEVKIIKHVAYLNDVAMDAKVKALEAEIESLQDVVTAFNHTQTIEIPD